MQRQPMRVKLDCTRNDIAGAKLCQWLPSTLSPRRYSGAAQKHADGRQVADLLRRHVLHLQQMTRNVSRDEGMTCSAANETESAALQVWDKKGSQILSSCCSGHLLHGHSHHARVHGCKLGIELLGEAGGCFWRPLWHALAPLKAWKAEGLLGL